MEMEEQIPTASRSNFKRFGLKNAIRTNFVEDFVFEIVAKDDWTPIAVSLSTNAVKLYSPQTGQYLGECKGRLQQSIGFLSHGVLYSCSSDSTIRAWDSRSALFPVIKQASVDGLMCLFSTGGEINDDDHLVSAETNFADCHYSPKEDWLWAIGGTKCQHLGYFPVNFGSKKTIGSAEAVFQGGHQAL